MTSEFDRQMQECGYTFGDTGSRMQRRPVPSSFHCFSSTGLYRQHKAYWLCVVSAVCKMHADSATLLISSRGRHLGRKMPDDETPFLQAKQLFRCQISMALTGKGVCHNDHAKNRLVCNGAPFCLGTDCLGD